MAGLDVETIAEQEAAADLVRAIRRVYGSPDGIGGVEKFTVHNVHEFARRLLDQGVTASGERVVRGEYCDAIRSRSRATSGSTCRERCSTFASRWLEFRNDPPA